MLRINLSLRILCLLTWILLLAIAGTVIAAEKTVYMKSRTFQDPILWDSNYTACLAASDGKVYVGLNHHGGGATVAVYDPKTDQISRKV